MISNPIEVFKRLDLELSHSNEFYQITISGGAVVALSFNGRVTNDVDVVLGELTDELLKASKVVAKELKLKPDWLNKSASSFNGNFSEGWERRAIVVYDGKNIKVKAISKQDMIRTKFFSFLTRGTDIEDLKLFKPSRKEILKLTKAAIERNITSRPAFDIILETNDLLIQLGYKEFSENEKNSFN